MCHELAFFVLHTLFWFLWHQFWFYYLYQKNYNAVTVRVYIFGKLMRYTMYNTEEHCTE